jgi:hypothetical protein
MDLIRSTRAAGLRRYKRVRSRMTERISHEWPALTGAGYFWPAWVIASWGAGLVLHAWDTFLRRPVTDADVDAELRRHRG